MSLSVYLTTTDISGHGPDRWVQSNIGGPAIFIREDGQRKEITREEWDRRYPGREPIIVDVPSNDNEVYSANITHNLRNMAKAAGIEQHLWAPEEIGITKAAQLIEPLRRGLANLRERPVIYQMLDAPNGWGVYKDFVPWVARYLEACETNPDADVSVSR